MFRTMMNGKIHRATVTEANLNYVGSITIDYDILDAVGMVENEKVQIVNNNNGARFETYIIPGERERNHLFEWCSCPFSSTRGYGYYYFLCFSIERKRLAEHHPKLPLWMKKIKLKN